MFELERFTPGELEVLVDIGTRITRICKGQGPTAARLERRGYLQKLAPSYYRLTSEGVAARNQTCWPAVVTP